MAAVNRTTAAATTAAARPDLNRESVLDTILELAASYGWLNQKALCRLVRIFGLKLVQERMVACVSGMEDRIELLTKQVERFQTKTMGILFDSDRAPNRVAGIKAGLLVEPFNKPATATLRQRRTIRHF
jgi:hypothetical protein